MVARVKATPASEEPAPKKLGMSDDHLIRQFEEMLIVDKHALDDALQEHPDLLYRITEIYIERASDRDAAKLALAEIEAEVDAKLRRDAQIAEEKITADQVKAAIKLDKRVQRAQDRHADLVYWCNRWAALQTAWNARQSSMRELVTLHGNNYWSDASSGRSKALVRSKAGDTARAALAAERARRRGDGA